MRARLIEAFLRAIVLGPWAVDGQNFVDALIASSVPRLLARR